MKYLQLIPVISIHPMLSMSRHIAVCYACFFASVYTAVMFHVVFVAQACS